mmetsp:Transcript_4795/g.6214  ORF Transcript_4795/g.6214 Transcript_4795/m.6214 type:complete len:114 (+) Transcript_4795:67-408(+)
MTMMRKIILYTYVQLLEHEEVNNLRVEFEQIDTDHSGQISYDELKHAIISSGIIESDSHAEQVVQEIVDNIDYVRDGYINYTEFLAATVEIDEGTLTQKRRDAIFKKFDIGNQ